MDGIPRLEAITQHSLLSITNYFGHAWNPMKLPPMQSLRATFSNTMSSISTLLLPLCIALLALANAGHAHITSDFVVPGGVVPDANFFTFKGLAESLTGAPKNATYKVTKASQVEFPALTNQGISISAVQFAPGGFNPPHIHPRGAELMLVLQGTLNVGLVDSNNKLYKQILHAGDTFLFPKALVHYQENADDKHPAIAVSAFGSTSPGVISLPNVLFGSGIDNGVLAKSFKSHAQSVHNLVSNITKG